MADSINNLKQFVREYRDLDNDLRILNAQVHEMRLRRREVESKMSAILQNESFRSVEKLRIEDDNSMVQIKHPLSYSKPWSCSKKDLTNLINEYFARGSFNASECIDYIISEQSKKLISTEFEFNRVVK
jgi:hypothetical protein